MYAFEAKTVPFSIAGFTLDDTFLLAGAMNVQLYPN